MISVYLNEQLLMLITQRTIDSNLKKFTYLNNSHTLNQIITFGILVLHNDLDDFWDVIRMICFL